MAKITLRNPDQQGIYHCWHYCRGCGQTWTHSQGDWEDIKEHIRHKHGGDWSLICTAPTDYLVANTYLGKVNLKQKNITLIPCLFTRKI